MFTFVRIALRNVVRNKRRTLITLAALIIGVSVMISMRSLLNGLQRALIVNVTERQTGHIQIHKTGYFANVLVNPLRLDFPIAPLVERLKTIPEIKAIAPRIAFSGMVSNGEQTLYTAFLAVDEKTEPFVTPLRAKTFQDPNVYPKSNRILLTPELADSVQLKTNNEAIVLAPDREGALSGELTTLKSTMQLALPGEKKVALVSLELAQKLLKMEGNASEIALYVHPIEHIPILVNQLQKLLGKEYEVHTWQEVAIFVRQAMQRQNFLISLVAFCFMFLMLLGVANALLMSVLERTREIGTMMAVGVKRRSILRLFVFEALTMGALGGFIGSVLGYCLVVVLKHQHIQFTPPGGSIPFELTPFITFSYICGVFLLATFGAGIFAFYPAYRASRMHPIDALEGR